MGGDDTNPALQSSTGNSDAKAAAPKAAAPTPAKAKPDAAQGAPTAPRAVDPDTGLELDAHGLPIAGVARRRWLADAGIEDPALKAAEITENPNG